MISNEAKVKIKKSLSLNAKEDLSKIYNENRKFAKQCGNQKWATENNAHLRKEIKNCPNHLDKAPIAFMQNSKLPVYLFLIENLNRTKKYNIIAVFDSNNSSLEIKRIFNEGQEWEPYVLTNRCGGYLNAIPNQSNQIFVNNPDLVSYIKSNKDLDENSRICKLINRCYEHHLRVPLRVRESLRRRGYRVVEGRVLDIYDKSVSE